ncbi:hypothetical protein [Methylobacterium durans]|uniref:hypothetical protein n=1 Tax=Methylobacterium durans TaxID=2202825 RepID=UPI0013A5B8D8|nr:hypothetical protein [Methylobacterium durans]
MAHLDAIDPGHDKPAPQAEPATPDTEAPAAPPDPAEPPPDIDAGIPEPLKRDVVPGERPADMPLPAR